MLTNFLIALGLNMPVAEKSILFAKIFVIFSLKEGKDLKKYLYPWM